MYDGASHHFPPRRSPRRPSETVRRLVESTGVFSPVEIDVAVELVDDRLQRGAASDYHFVFAEEEGRTLGYACYGPIALTAASFDLYWIAVDKSLHGRKIGQALLEETEKLIAAGRRPAGIHRDLKPQPIRPHPRLLSPLRLPARGAA